MSSTKYHVIRLGKGQEVVVSMMLDEQFQVVTDIEKARYLYGRPYPDTIIEADLVANECSGHAVH